MEENENKNKINTELIPVEQIKEMIELGVITPKTTEAELSNKLDEEFKSFLNSDDEEITDAVKKHNKKTLSLLTDHKESIDEDLSATGRYQVRYDRETWYYKRHKDTIDKYNRKPSKIKAKTDAENIVVEDDKDYVARIGYAKMSSIVWFDIIIMYLGYILFSPFYLLRELVDLFFKMKKSLAITVLVVFGIIVLTVGLVFGIGAILRLAQSSS